MKVVTFGELMVRLQPFNYERFVQANSLEFSFGGGEANVAVSLANYGLDAAFVTKLPAHAIGQAAVNSLRRYGVDTRGFNFSRLPKELAETDTQAFKGELGSMRDVLGEIQSDMYKSMEKNKPAKNKEQER